VLLPGGQLVSVESPRALGRRGTVLFGYRPLVTRLAGVRRRMPPNRPLALIWSNRQAQEGNLCSSLQQVGVARALRTAVHPSTQP